MSSAAPQPSCGGVSRPRVALPAGRSTPRLSKVEAAPLPVVGLRHGCRARERRLGVGILWCRGVCGRRSCVAACRGRKHLRHFVGAFRGAHVHKLAAVAQEPQLLSVAIVFWGDAGWQLRCPLFGSVMDAERENAGLASAFFGAAGDVDALTGGGAVIPCLAVMQAKRSLRYA